MLGVMLETGRGRDELTLTGDCIPQPARRDRGRPWRDVGSRVTQVIRELG